jgi:hypothetical protein
MSASSHEVSVQTSSAGYLCFATPIAGLFHKYWMASLTSDNTDVILTTALIFQQAEVCFSLIAGTIPCLKSFIQSFDTGSGVKAGFGSTHTSGYGRHSKVHHGSNAEINDEERTIRCRYSAVIASTGRSSKSKLMRTDCSDLLEDLQQRDFAEPHWRIWYV